jgi:hypothetical protein
MGEVHLDLAADPLALVTPARARDVLERELLEPLGRVPYVVTSPVTLQVWCPTRPSWQPGAVDYPNLDRWLRPLVDALAGAQRLLLSGSQVMTVDARTAPPPGERRGLSVRVAFASDACVPKTTLRLVAFPAGWCASVPTDLTLPRAREITRRLSETVTTAGEWGSAQPLVRQGFIRRRDVASDVPVVEAAALLQEAAVPLQTSNRARWLAGQPSAPGGAGD